MAEPPSDHSVLWPVRKKMQRWLRISRLKTSRFENRGDAFFSERAIRSLSDLILL